MWLQEWGAEDQGPGGWEKAINKGKICKSTDIRRPRRLRIDQGWMGLSIGRCKENSKPEKEV